MASIKDLLRNASHFTRSILARGDMQSRVDTFETIPTLYWEQWANVVHGLTPARLRSILQAADDGDILMQHQLFSDMEDHCDHLGAEIGKRKRALLTLDWEILPARADNKESVRIAEAVREQFDLLSNTEDLFLDMADGIAHGFSALEIEWTRDAGLHLPQAFHFRPQTWFQTLPENRNLLRLRNNTYEGAELIPFGWVLHTHRSRSGWLPRAGLFRVLAWSYLIRSYALASNTAYVEIHGLPLRIGKYPAHSSPEDKAALRRALQSLGRDASGIMPDGMEILFQTPANSTHDHFGTLIDRCERGMSKAILGGTLTSQADGKTSTNALGNVHNEIRHDLLVSDAMQIAGTVTRQILAPLAILNAGVTDTRLLPWFRFDTREAEDLSIYADALPKLATVMQIPAKWAHDKLKIPQPEKGEEILQVRGEGDKASASVAMLTANGEVAGYTDKDTSQKNIDTLAGSDSVNNALEKASLSLLLPLFNDLDKGLEASELMARLSTLYPEMDETELSETMAKALFVAEIWGRVHG